MGYRLRLICTEYLKNNWLLAIAILIFFVAGVVFGALGAKALAPEIKVELSETIQKFLDKVSGISVDRKTVVIDVALRNLYIMASMYVLGLSVIGALLVPVLVFTRGFTIGFTMGFLTYDQAWKGLFLSVVSVLPQNIMYIPALLLGGLLTLSFSLFFIKGRLMFREFETGRPLIFYSLGMLAATLLTTLGCLTESYITPALIKHTTALLF